MKSLKPQAPQPLPLTSYDYDAIAAVIDGVDATARGYEDKWGVGRLELLVSDELREKFRRQKVRFDEAIQDHDVVRVRVSGAAMRRAWEALDKAAQEAGAKELTPEVWEIETTDGRVIAFCRHFADSYSVFRSGRYVEIWTPEEIVRLIEKYPEIVLGKKVFPGAYVESVRTKRISDTPDALEDMVIYEEEREEGT